MLACALCEQSHRRLEEVRLLESNTMNHDRGDTITGLLARARGGDREALDRLFALCRNYMTIVARTQVESWLRAKFDPSDLVQQTLLEAYRGFNGFHGATEGEWLAWLRRILTRNALDVARHYARTDKRQIRREVSLDKPAADSAARSFQEPRDSGESPSQQLLARERELLIADALARLAPDHREVIILRNLQGLPFDQVAQRMDRSRAATQMLWMRAIQKLQEVVSEEVSGTLR
jgi:RNA polymerase sigma-70 factor (ECF subfamily)